MAESHPKTRPLWLLKTSALIVAWGGLVYAAAVGPKATGPWEMPSLCGPWGCTAETDDLIAYHLVWLALTIPLCVWATRHWRKRRWSRIGYGMIGVAVSVIVVTSVAAMFYWRTQHATVGEAWPWRYGLYLLFRNADFPVLPTLLGGLTFVCVSRERTAASDSSPSFLDETVSTN